jgi:hypothetical protein
MQQKCTGTLYYTAYESFCNAILPVCPDCTKGEILLKLFTGILKKLCCVYAIARSDIFDTNAKPGSVFFKL